MAMATRENDLAATIKNAPTGIVFFRTVDHITMSIFMSTQNVGNFLAVSDAVGCDPYPWLNPDRLATLYCNTGRGVQSLTLLPCIATQVRPLPVAQPGQEHHVARSSVRKAHPSCCTPRPRTTFE